MRGLRLAIRIGTIVALVLLALGSALNLLTEPLICFNRCPPPQGYADNAFRYALVLLGPGIGVAALVWLLWLVLLARRRIWVWFGLVLLAVPLLAVPLASFVWAGGPWVGRTSIEDVLLDATTRALPGRLSFVALCVGAAEVVSLLASFSRGRLTNEALSELLSDPSE